MIALVDCNNFFASCERLFRPDLKDQPVLVLSSNDGCVVARSEEVKKLGVPMGVPAFQVRDIIKKHKINCFSSNFALYSDMSQRVLAILEQSAPEIEIYSVDEAFLNLEKLPIKNYQIWADQLSLRIKKEVGLPVSVGIAPTKTLAKLASSYAKKQQKSCIIAPQKDLASYQTILKQVPVGSVWGIGRRLTPKLQAANIRTAWALSQTNSAWLHKTMGINGTRMQGELKGQAAYNFQEEKQPQKSLLVSRSFGHTVRSIRDLETALATFASKAAFRLRRHEQRAGQFGIFLAFRNEDGKKSYRSLSRRISFPTNDTSILVSQALDMLTEAYDDELGYKKAGVFAGNLTSANICQLDWLDPVTSAEKDRRKSFHQAIDSINRRYGENMVHVGSLNPKAKQWQVKKELISPAYTTDWSQLPVVQALK